MPIPNEYWDDIMMGRAELPDPPPKPKTTNELLLDLSKCIVELTRRISVLEDVINNMVAASNKGEG